ncbi:MAG: nicotinate (nicotinamide) nucleotide adenylyltransferase [Desulfovibrionaceae bacterium]
MAAQCIGILGGSFNPIHVGHLRLAIEVYEALSPRVDYIDFVPCAQPPHKNNASLLPFDLRARLVQAAVVGMPFLRVNTIESQRQGPSYTYDTLLAYKQQFPAASYMFLLGGEDFATINQWHKGAELPRLTNIVVVPRAGAHSSSFCQTVNTLWPEAVLEPTPAGGYHAQTQWGTQLLYLPLPRLDVSASLVRSRWIDGKRIEYFLPQAALEVLQKHQQQSIEIWSYSL